MDNVREGSSGTLTITLKQHDGIPIPKVSLETLTLTLYDVETDQVINSRSGVNIFDAHGCTVADDGTATLSLTPADNVVIDRNRPYGEPEIHAALVKFTAAVNIAGNAELRFTVERVR